MKGQYTEISGINVGALQKDIETKGNEETMKRKARRTERIRPSATTENYFTVTITKTSTLTKYPSNVSPRVNPVQP